MKEALKNVLLTLAALCMLLGLALAVPSGMLTEEAQSAHLDEAPADADDEYAFLFE